MTHITPSMKPHDSLDAIHDLYLDDTGNLAMATGADAIAEHVRWRIGTFEGEWFLDTEAGMPWFEKIMGKASDLPLAESLLKAEILATEGVTAITEFSARYDRTKRSIVVDRAVVETIYGSATL